MSLSITLMKLPARIKAISPELQQPLRIMNAILELANDIEYLLSREEEKLPLLTTQPYDQAMSAVINTLDTDPVLRFDDLVNAVIELMHEAGVRPGGAYKTALLVPIASVYREWVRPKRPAKPGMSVEQWLACDDVGKSSKFMVCTLSGNTPADYAHPHDLSDFSRCAKALDAIKPLRLQLSKMSATSPQWQALVKCWDSIDTLRHSSRAEANKLLQRCIASPPTIR